MNAHDVDAWDEDAAFAQVRDYFNRIGDSNAEAWALLKGEAAPLLVRFGEDIAAGLDAQDRAALESAWQRFRKDFAVIWRESREWAEV